MQCYGFLFSFLSLLALRWEGRYTEKGNEEGDGTGCLQHAGGGRVLNPGGFSQAISRLVTSTRERGPIPTLGSSPELLSTTQLG